LWWFGVEIRSKAIDWRMINICADVQSGACKYSVGVEFQERFKRVHSKFFLGKFFGNPFNYCEAEGRIQPVSQRRNQQLYPSIESWMSTLCAAIGALWLCGFMVFWS